MSVQSSLTRCVRPMLQSSLPARGQLFRGYQRAGYASNDSSNPNKETEKHESSSSAPSQDPQPSIFDKLNLGQPNSDNAPDSTTDQAAKLAERMADIRAKMNELSRPAKYDRPGREFFATPKSAPSSRSGSGKFDAEAEARKTLDSIRSRVPSAAAATLRHLSRTEKFQQQEPQAPTRDLDTSRLVSSSAMARLDDISPPKLKPIAMKLGTKLGRQVFVQNDRGIDCASAIRSLQINCATNGVRRQANLQKFHVRRGQRRKDLKSERWRRLFKFSFDETVKKIQRMRNQGW